MEREVQIRQAAQQWTAVVRVQTSGQNLSRSIREILSESAVYSFLKAAGINTYGRNVMLYQNVQDDGDAALPPAGQGILLEVGVQVPEAFRDTDGVLCSSTPQGQVASLLHVGAYEQLGRTHDSIIRWCQENNRALTGVRWEVYGHWNDDPNKLETEVFYLLK